MPNTVQKPNDIFVATLKAPEISTFELLKNLINAENTSLLNPEDYKNTPLVLKMFSSEDGKTFNEDAFNKAYLLAALKYTELSNAEALSNFNSELEYSASSRYRALDAKVQLNPVRYERIFNPRELAIGLEGISRISNPEKTEEELAQGNHIYDPKLGKFIDDTPETLALHKKAFGRTLVYAKWDSDGTHIDERTGLEVAHYKGQWKTDIDGKYYTEFLDGEELLDKQVVSVGDILTKENSWINKLDFFDSDGYDKSAGGVAMKLLITAAPYLIPGVNTYYGMLTMGLGLASVMPTFYKSIASIFEGEDLSVLSQNATRLENWFRKFNSSKSHYGREHFLSFESAGDMLGDIFGQLYQQRAAASLSKLFTTDFSKALNAAARALSVGYMSLISAADVYNDALQGGYSHRAAGLASLATAAGLFGIMEFNESARGLGTWFLDETTGYTKELERGPLAKLAKKYFKKFAENANKIEQEGVEKGKKSLAKTFKEFYGDARNAFEDYITYPTEGIWKNAIVEGVEEVTEEVVQDTVKGIFDTLSWLGLNDNQGSFGGWQNVFSKEGFERYLATLLGGAAGGALFHIQQFNIDPFMRSLFNGTPTILKKVDLDLVDIFLQGRTDELIKEIERQAKIQNIRLAPGTIKVGDYDVTLTAKEGESQADFIKNAVIKYVLTADFLLKEQFGNNADSMMSYAFWRNQFGKEVTTRFEEAEFDKYMDSKYQDAMADLLDTLQKRPEKETPEYKKLIDEKVKAVKDFAYGDAYLETVGEYNIYTNPGLRSFLLNLDMYSWAMNLYGVDDFNKFTAEEKANIKKDFDQWQSDLKGGQLKEALPRARKVLDLILLNSGLNIVEFTLSENKKVLTDSLIQAIDDYKKAYEDAANTIYDKDNAEKDKELRQEALGKLSISGYQENFLQILKSHPKAITLTDRYKFDLASILIDKGIFKLSEMPSDIEALIKNIINDFIIQLRIMVFDADTIELIRTGVNAAIKSNADNIYVKKIYEILDKNESESSEENKAFDIETFVPISNVDISKVDNDVIYSKLMDITSYGGNVVELRWLDAINNLIIWRLEKIAESLSPDDELVNIIQFWILDIRDNKDLAIGDVDNIENDLIQKEIKNILDLYLKNKSKTVIQNPLNNAVKNLYTLFGKDSNILKFIFLSEENIRNSNEFKSFVLTADQTEAIGNALIALSSLLAAVHSMIKSGDNLVMGYSEAARAYLNLYGVNKDLVDNFNVISKEDGELVLNWIEEVKDKLNYIAYINGETTRERHRLDLEARLNHDRILANLYRSNKFLIEVEGNKFDLLTLDVESIDLPDDLFIALAETNIYQNLNKIRSSAGKNIDSEIIDAIISAYSDGVGLVDYTAWAAIGKDKTNHDVIKNNYLVHRIVSLMHYNPGDYRKDLIDIYTAEEGKTIYPSFSQELAIRLLLAATHSELGYAIETLLALKIGDIEVELNSESALVKTNADHIISLIGAPGVGKNFTLGLVKSKIARFLGKDGKIYAASKTDRKVESLRRDLKLENDLILTIDLMFKEASDVGETFNSVISKVLNYIANKEAGKEEIDGISITQDGNIYHVELKIKDSSIKYDITVDTSGNSVSLLNITFTQFLNDPTINRGLYIVDEASLINPYVAQYLQLAAKNSESLIIFSGDHTQMGYEIEYKDVLTNANYTIPYSFAKYNTINCPVMTGSLRLNNTGLLHNVETMRNALYGIKTVSESDYPVSSLDADILYTGKAKYKEYFAKAENHFIYHPELLLGTELTQQDKVFLDKLNKIIDSGKTFAIVADKAYLDEAKTRIEPLLKGDLKDNVLFLTPELVQGDEYDYIIGYNLLAKGERDADVDTQKVNMLITRCRSYGLFYEKDNKGLMSALDIQSDADPHIAELTSTNESNIQAAYTKQLEDQLAVIDEVDTTEGQEEPKIDVTEDDEGEEDDDVYDLQEEIHQEEPQLQEVRDGSPKQQKVILEFKLAIDKNQESPSKKIDADVSIIHNFYVRLGVTRAEYEYAIEHKISIDDFVKKCQDNDDFKCFVTNYEDLRRQFNLEDSFPSKLNNLEEALLLYHYFTKYFVEHYDNYVAEDSTLRLVVSGRKYNSDLDWCYDKFNDNEKEYLLSTLLRVGVKVGENMITIARFGYNAEENEDSNLSFSKHQNRLFKLVNNSDGEIRRTLKPKADLYDVVKKYLDNRGIKGFDSEKIPTKRYGLVMYERARDYHLDVTNELNKKLFNDMRYGRYLISEMGKHGWNLTEANIYDVKDEASLKDDLRLELFKKWYNQFRIEQLTDKDNEWIRKVYKRKWAVAQFGPCESLLAPVLVDLISALFEPKRTPLGRLKLSSQRLLLIGIAEIAKQSDDEDLKNLYDNLKGLHSNKDSAAIAELIKNTKDKLASFLSLLLLDSGVKSKDQYLAVLDLMLTSFEKKNGNDSPIFAAESLKAIVDELLPDYFFKINTNASGWLKELSDHLYVSRVFEAGRFFFLWDAFEQEVADGEIADLYNDEGVNVEELDGASPVTLGNSSIEAETNPEETNLPVTEDEQEAEIQTENDENLAINDLAPYSTGDSFDITFDLVETINGKLSLIQNQELRDKIALDIKLRCKHSNPRTLLKLRSAINKC